MLLDMFDATKALTPVVFFTTALLIFFGFLIQYFIFTAPAYWFYKKGLIKGIQLQSKVISNDQIKKEIFWSMLSILQFVIFTLILLIVWRSGGFPKFYIHPLEKGWPHLFLSIGLLVIFCDAHFYFIHRLLHLPFFRKIHAVHHQSKVPTPFVLYAFHPIESFLHFTRFPLCLALFACSPLTLLLAELFALSVNVYGHLNFEVKWVRHLLKTGITTSGIFHNLHHTHAQGNYGFYFMLWDRLFKTVHPMTDSALNQIQHQWKKK
jgi:Delta7-sterol 5-desaturase